MKRKLLLAAVFAAGALGMRAQTDVTSTYLTNADFSSITGWNTVNGGGTTFNQSSGSIGTKILGDRTEATVDESHLSTEYCIGFSCRWNNVYAAYQQETKTLPAGYYELSYDVEDTNSGSTKIDYQNHFYVQVGETKTTDSSTEWMNAGASAWTTHTILFNIAEESKATISLGYGNNENKNTTPNLYVSHLKLRQYADKDTYLRIKNNLTEASFSNPVITSFVTNGTFDDSDISKWVCNTSFQNRGRKTTDDGGAGNMNNSKPWWENWNGSALVNKMYQTVNNIPNGTYRLDITAFVNNFNGESQYVFANSDKTYLTEDAKSGASYEVYTVVTTNQVEIGLEQTTATANWMGIDNVSLRYYGAGDVINDAKNAAHKLAWQEAKAAAEAAIADDTYANVTGSEKSDLQEEIDKTEPTTADGYDDAAAALIAATSTFTAAKSAYDAYAEIRSVAVALSVAPGDAPANAAAAPAATHALNVAVYTATTADNFFDVTEVYAPSWSSMTTSTGQHWSGDASIAYADNWSGSANTTERTATITLPAGSYVLIAAGRGSANTVPTMSANGTMVTFASNGDMGIGINKLGAASFDSEDAAGFANKDGQAENSGTGWEWRYIPVTLAEETAVTVTQTLTRLSGNAWGSFSDFKIMKVGVVATTEDYTALNSAISDAAAKTLGFEDGEYAPYKNVEALKALAAANAINQTETNDQETVQAVTTALTSATWTANTVEVDAIFDGQFATTAANETSGNINLPGWTKVEGIRLLVKNENVDPGLAYTDGKAAVFSWGGTTLTYGEQTGYTLPLNKHSIYKLTFKASAWRDGTWPSWVSVELDGVAQSGATSVPGKINDAEGNPFRTYTYYLEPTADNSVLKIYMNQHFTLADLSLKLAVAEDLEISESADYTPAEAYANVTLTRTIKGDGTWNTFVVPFDISNEELVAAFGENVAVAEYSDEADGLNSTINFNTMATPAITANTPVLLKGNAGTSFTFNDKLIKTGDAKVAGTNFDFVGTYAASTDIDAGDYFIGSNQLWKSEGTTTIAGTRAYLKANTQGGEVKVRFVIDDETATSIEGIEFTENVENGKVYDISGRLVTRPVKGLYIKNGKKFIVK